MCPLFFLLNVSLITIAARSGSTDSWLQNAASCSVESTMIYIQKSWRVYLAAALKSWSDRKELHSVRAYVYLNTPCVRSNTIGKPKRTHTLLVF